MVDCFAITPEGEAQKFVEYVKATKGHKDKVLQVYGKVALRFTLNNATIFLQRMREFIPILNDLGYLDGMISEDGTRFKAYRKWVPITKLTIHQLFAAFASFQMACGKLFEQVCLEDLNLMTKAIDRRVYFRANNIEVVLDALFRVLFFNVSPVGHCPRDYEELKQRFSQFVIDGSELLQFRPLARAAT